LNALGIIVLISMAVTGLCSCDDSFIDIIEQENRCRKEIPSIPPALYGTSFPIADTGFTVNISEVDGDDGEYINVPDEISFHDTGTGTVIDNVTGLQWTRCSAVDSGTLGSYSTDCDDVTPGSTMTYGEALSFCDDLVIGGYNDWRLPTVPELFSLYDFGEIEPAINQDYFPHTQAGKYVASHEILFWGLDCDTVVDFDNVTATNGNILNTILVNIETPNTFYVRCVR